MSVQFLQEHYVGFQLPVEEKCETLVSRYIESFKKWKAHMKGMLVLENEEGNSTSDSQWFSKIYA